MIRTTVNGKPREFAADRPELPLLDLLDQAAVNPRLVAVAINGDVVPKSSFAQAVVRDGDSIEIVRMVGGGMR